ncbi:glycosyltransferase [Mesorhizobium sp. M00.F.Ca.ET.216.01.1.1]|uniref:glycosyltransferase n=1 Tax=Mesorhizobium sp. M00.F.Ca.ET.216.01.1.1 TaxID=2500528 RepID=UPI000FD6BF23|nr:glycosyltransferase [Mesorhizobium sp. M00.F.Ca.ET.216.01.1.1]TGQ31238.1 glycosyltransferase [Mesorhizobium sp. M00.F.Ca.ET.216.01.1.1]TJW09385.1 MAG: glycosyltransferase [Mesorhizobium sp.]
MHSVPNGIPVSIVIPNYNYARFLKRCIDSALGQDYADVEVIVVDDASQDGSAAIIKSYGDRILACLRRGNGGHAAAFNTGFAASSGKIVLFLDADDYLYPDAVSRIVDTWDAATAQVQSRLHIVDEGQRIKDVFPPPELPFDSGDVMPKLLHKGRYQTTVTSGLAFDRATLESIMPIPEKEFRQGADGYLVTLAPLYGHVQSIDECVGAYRIHGANHSVFGEKLAERARWRVSHDFRRMEALSDQASEVGMAVVPSEAFRHDPVHLEERLASLCADRRRHPVADDSRLALAAAGAVASFEMTASLRRRAVLAAWFLSVGMLPRQMAMAVLSWKLEASSRPAFLARMSKTIRHAMG